MVLCLKLYIPAVTFVRLLSYTWPRNNAVFTNGWENG